MLKPEDLEVKLSGFVICLSVGCAATVVGVVVVAGLWHLANKEARGVGGTKWL